MPTTPTPGTEPLPATYGGRGFQPRRGSHADDVGRLWSACGVASEVAPLREVLLTVPGDEVEFGEPPDRWLMLERLELPRLASEADGVAAYFTSQGVAVHRYAPPTRPPPNLVFMRDLFFMTPEGAVLARMGVQQRAGEERFAAHALASCGIPLIAAIRGIGTFEGADALWLDRETVIVGVGQRTNRAGVVQLRRILADLGTRTFSFPLPRGVQHLLGVVNFVDRRLAVTWRERLSTRLRAFLRQRDIRLIELERSEELEARRAMNFVTIRPRHVVMPAGAPETRARLEMEGIRCDEVKVDQYLRAAGGLGCLTGIIHRTDD